MIRPFIVSTKKNSKNRNWTHVTITTTMSTPSPQSALTTKTKDNPASKVKDKHKDEHEVDNSSFSTTDFEGVDFGTILAELDLIRQDGRIRSETGSYHTVDSALGFTRSEIIIRVRNDPETPLRQYFRVRGTWPNFH